MAASFAFDCRLLAGAAVIAAACASCRAASRPAPAAARSGRRKRVYTPADFARFAPKTAYDMLAQVPSFTIRTRGPGARARPGVRERADQRPAHRQQIGRRGRPAAAHLGRRTSTGSRSSTPPASAFAGLSGQVANVILKSQTEGRPASSNGIPSFRAHFTKPQYATRLDQLFRAGRARSITRSRRRALSGRGGLGGPVVISDRNHVAHRNARTKSIISEYQRVRTSRRSSGSMVPARRSAT